MIKLSNSSNGEPGVAADWKTVSNLFLCSSLARDCLKCAPARQNICRSLGSSNPSLAWTDGNTALSQRSLDAAMKKYVRHQTANDTGVLCVKLLKDNRTHSWTNPSPPSDTAPSNTC